jgi:hypothetical protein
MRVRLVLVGNEERFLKKAEGQQILLAQALCFSWRVINCGGFIGRGRECMGRIKEQGW